MAAMFVNIEKRPTMNLESIIDFLEPIDKFALNGDDSYHEKQIGRHVAAYEGEIPDISESALVIVGCGEARGAGLFNVSSAPDKIRTEFYRLYHWHRNIHIADLGNLKTGATVQDSIAVLKTVVNELVANGKRVLILGGSHDLTLGQYGAHALMEKTVEMACIDANIDLNMGSLLPNERFMMELLTSEPNYISHYNHIGFQSYFVHPEMLETIDKLRFDCYRAGKVRENIPDMEPVLRNSQLLSFDINAIQYGFAPANIATPNGFTGDEACQLMRYAGMNHQMKSIGIYGFDESLDQHDITAKQISHMIWYLMDGIYKGSDEAGLIDREKFYDYPVSFSGLETIFLQSKITGRWWMKTFDDRYIACSKQDYITACNDEIPERWMRAAERF